MSPAIPSSSCWVPPLKHMDRSHIRNADARAWNQRPWVLDMCKRHVLPKSCVLEHNTYCSSCRDHSIHLRKPAKTQVGNILLSIRAGCTIKAPSTPLKKQMSHKVVPKQLTVDHQEHKIVAAHFPAPQLLGCAGLAPQLLLHL